MPSQSTRGLYLEPRSVVFVGVPRRSGPGSLNPVDNLKKWAYQGNIRLVHPHVSEIAGIPVVPQVSDLNGPADLAVISTPRETVPGIIAECGKLGIRAAVVTVQGFAEADSRGADIQRLMVEESRRWGVRILGPNTLGVSNAFSRFNTSFMPMNREEVPVGVVCQSGVFFVGVKQLIGGMGMGVDVGNACDVGITETLEWLGSEEKLKVIALHAEELKQGKEFIRVAEQVSRRIPIVALKTGRSSEGAKAAASHSGSMAGEDRVVDAALRKAGMIRVDETQEMADLIQAFRKLPPMKGPRVAVITLTGAGGILLLDAMERYGLQRAQFSDGTLDAIQALSPEWMPLSNPMDIWPAVMKNSMKTGYGAALKGVLQDPNVDGVFCLTLGLESDEQKSLGAEDLIGELAEKYQKPVVVWCYGSRYDDAAARLKENYAKALPVPSLERGIKVLAAMARYEGWRQRCN